MNEMYLYYRLTSTLFDHHDITALTGITPTRAWNIGDVRRLPRQRKGYAGYAFSAWRVQGRTPHVHDLRVHLEQLVALLNPAWPALCDLGSLYWAGIECSMHLYPGQPPPSIMLPPSILQCIADLHADFGIDIYCYVQDEDESDLPPGWRDMTSVEISMDTIETTYTLRGADLDPKRITAMTGILPSSVWEVSAMQPGSNQDMSYVSTDAGWAVTARRVASYDSDDSVQALMDDLLPAWNVLHDLGRQFSARVTCSLRTHTGESTPSMGISAALAAKLVDLNATLDIRLHCIRSDVFYVPDISRPTT